MSADSHGVVVPRNDGHAMIRYRFVRERVARWVFVDPSPLVKQFPFFVLFSVAALLIVFLPAFPISNVMALIAGAFTMLASTALAAVFTARKGLLRFAAIIPAADFIALALLRLAAGENASIFGSLVILPLVWIASEPGRRYIAFAAGGSIVSLLLPQVLGTGVILGTETEVVRTLFSPLAFTVAAVVVNELSRLARDRLASVRERELAGLEEMDRAAVVQRALLPKAGDSFLGYDMAGICMPSRSVGGDFYDWYPLQGGLAMTLGDVMGKGVGAGLVAAAARAVVRDAVDEENDEVALRRMGIRLRRELLDADTFMTFFHARVHSDDGSVVYADAGHGLSVVIRMDGTHERLTSVDYPLGLGSGEPWVLHQTNLNPGDMLVSVSDGVLDLYDGSLAALDSVVALSRGTTSARGLVESLALHARNQINPDDVTIVVMQRDLVPTQLVLPAESVELSAPAGS